jgi:magnesium-protoporphyrin O-methyltransferase
MLIDAFVAVGVEGKTLLDIGGGVGMMHHELLKAGAANAVGVDASTAYIRAAKEEAHRQGHGDRVRHHHGDFVMIAPSLEPADLVALDRVICCYHDVEALVGLSSALATELYGVIYPRDNLLSRGVWSLFNLFFRLTRNPFRVFVHASSTVDGLVRRSGLRRRYYRKTFAWQVAVYGR